MPPISIAYTLAPGAHAPTRATPGSAGLDLHAHLPDGVRVTIPPGRWTRIRTGVHLALPHGYEGQIRPRSGLALKQGLTVLNSPGTIDSDYRGELEVILINHSDAHDFVHHGDRIAQLVIAPVADAVLCPADALPPTERGEGGFGSTGTGPVAATVPVTLTRRSPDAARAYHEGYAAALRSVAGWLREKADASENIAAQHGVVGGWLGDCATGSDDDRARLEARVRALEAEVSEARAERDKWGAELDALRADKERRRDVYDLMGAVEHSASQLAAHEDRGAWGERAAVVAYLRQSASVAVEFGAVADTLTAEADAIERGEHRAGGAR